MAVGLGDVWVTDSTVEGNGVDGCCVAVVQRIDAETNTVEATFDARAKGYGSDVWVDADGMWGLPEQRRPRPTCRSFASTVVGRDHFRGGCAGLVVRPRPSSGLTARSWCWGIGDRTGTHNNTLVELHPPSGAVVNVTPLGEEGCPPAVAAQSSGYGCGVRSE